ncbi:type I-U CRISPR-associated protein Cas8c [Rhodocista pekingensis]|uniref:Type I-U CRISPR-associated protein Cas8c n=1 Tax=Rhodocista pekingensis TaxID=201185 RepID=A0ABW2KTT4_9PROT
MATSSIPVDLRNPGQVFACLGLMEAAEILCGPTEGGFIWKDRETQVRFTLTAPGEDDPVLTVLRFLTQAEALALAPSGSALAAKEAGVPTQPFDPAGTYPCPAPTTPSALPTQLIGPGGDKILLSSWADGSHVGRDTMKFWGGASGYSGAALTRDALNLVRPLGGNSLAVTAADPFAFARPQTSSFRFDWRRDYIPLDVGFSPNDHDKKVRMVGYPLVELLAAIGLQHARPLRLKKLTYRYGAWGAKVPTLFARALLGLGNPGFPIRSFTMHLGWPGQEGQARCIKDALEDTAP